MKKPLVERIISEIDENQNESITFDEFAILILRYNKEFMPHYLNKDNDTIVRELKDKLQENLGLENWMYWLISSLWIQSLIINNLTSINQLIMPMCLIL